MFGEFIKILADEPEKIGKVCIRAVRLTLNVIIAAALYRLVVGPAKLMTVDSYSEWSDFILSGRVLIYLFFFLIAEYIISQLLELLEYYISTRIYKYFLKDQKYIIRILLKSFGIISYNNQDKDIERGKNYSEFQRIYTSLQEDNFKDLDLNKESFIAQIRENYIVFLVVYFLLIKHNGYPFQLDALIIIIYLMILLTQSIMSVMFDFLRTPPLKFLNQLNTINIYTIVKDQLRKFNVSKFEQPNDIGLKKFRKFYHWDKEFMLAPIKHEIKVDHNKIDEFLKKHSKKDTTFIFILYGPLTEEYAALQSKYFRSLILVNYESVEMLPGNFSLAFSQVAFDLG